MRRRGRARSLASGPHAAIVSPPRGAGRHGLDRGVRCRVGRLPRDHRARTVVPERESRGWKAAELTVTSGAAKLDGDSLVVAAAGAANPTIVAIATDLRSSEFAAVTWNVHGVPDDADVRMLWKSDIAPSRTNQYPSTVEAGRLRRVVLAGNPAWIGRVQGIALAIRGAAGRAITHRGRFRRSHGGTADPRRAPARMAGVRAFQRCVDQYDHRRCRWAGPAVATARRARRSRSPPCCCGERIARGRGFISCSAASTLAGLFVVAWFALDARWMTNLVRETGLTLARYGGKSTARKARRRRGRALFAFVEKARAVHAGGARARLRRRRHALLPRARRVPPVSAQRLVRTESVTFSRGRSWLQAGDWLLVYQRRGIQYNAAKGNRCAGTAAPRSTRT